MKTLQRSLSILTLSLALGACAGQQTQTTVPVESTPPPVAPTPEPTPAPTPTPAPVVHAEAHLTNGHITLEHQIMFDTDAAHIQEGPSSAVLTDLAALMRENTQIRRVRIEGHTDTRGVAARNQTLSQQRAEAVAAYLRGHGFENIQFEAVGYGATQPLCRETTDACHERNRRVEFTITDPAPAPAAQ
ncbi:MAG: OmpA family protein [Deltaproteobacteria bacterium]|nr:OmpA family protein [Deltaproteobacteria bacterium]